MHFSRIPRNAGGHGSGANLKERAHTSALQFTYFVRKLMDPLTTASVDRP